MPAMPVLTPQERGEIKRWEMVVGKALKDWATRIMTRDGVTRDEARGVILRKIKEMDVPADWLCSQPGCGLLHSEHK